ncbi:unnamed protein product [Phytomonas sp. Hart1]|nr:unnamed protein product [Phytomonas sp. Hart1]|eukprot:CCW71260.1 unnamed protein product [Phytomonas sp. isolate Hart1]
MRLKYDILSVYDQLSNYINEFRECGMKEAKINGVLGGYLAHLWYVQQYCSIIDDYINDYATCKKTRDDIVQAERDTYKDLMDSVCDMGQDRDRIWRTIVDRLKKGQSSEKILGYLKTLESEMKIESNRAQQMIQERERTIESICQSTDDLPEPMTRDKCNEIIQQVRGYNKDENYLNKHLDTMANKLKLEREKINRDKFERDLKWNRRIYGDRDRAIRRICISTADSSRPVTRVACDSWIDTWYFKGYDDTTVNAKLWEMVHKNEKKLYKRLNLSKSDIAERNRLYDEEGTRHAQYILNIENRERAEKEERERIEREEKGNGKLWTVVLFVLAIIGNFIYLIILEFFL